MSTVAKAIMTTNPVERQFYEDQITVNLWARKLMIGNSRVIVVDGVAGDSLGFDVATVTDHDALRETCEAHGYRLIYGSALFTDRDAPRKFVTK